MRVIVNDYYLLLGFSAIISSILVLLVTSVSKVIYQSLRHHTIPAYTGLKLRFDGVIPAILGGVWGVCMGYIVGWIIGIWFFNDQMYSPLFAMVGGASGGCIAGVISGALKFNIDEKAL